MIVSMIHLYEECPAIVYLRKKMSTIIVVTFTLASLMLVTSCTLFNSLPTTTQSDAASTPADVTQVPINPTTTNTPAPTPTVTPIPRVLTVCLGAEPDTLYLYGGNMMSQRHILEADI